MCGLSNRATTDQQTCFHGYPSAVNISFFFKFKNGYAGPLPPIYFGRFVRMTAFVCTVVTFWLTVSTLSVGRVTGVCVCVCVGGGDGQIN